MGLSSNTLLHTTKKEGLKGILKDFAFRPRYCLEELYESKYSLDYAFPMISFSDFPISELKYRNSYGDYGLGMKKAWAKRNGLNPVLYIEKKSTLIKTVYDQISIINNLNYEDMEFDNIHNSFFTFLSYMKNYEGLNEKLKIPKYRFSDEREWRFLPPIDAVHKLGLEYGIDSHHYLKHKPEINKTIFTQKLNFKANDINYIIIGKENERNEVIEIIRQSQTKLSKGDIDNLLSRIITMTRIKYDF